MATGMIETFRAALDQCILEKHMNEMNGKANGNKSQTNAEGRTGALPWPSNRYRGPLGATAHKTPYSTVLINPQDLLDQATMRSVQLAAVLGTMPSASYPAPLILLALKLALDIAPVLENRGDGQEIAGQLAALLHSLDGEDGPCDLLWLCQQMADEVRAIAVALSRSRKVGSFSE